jgi:hypothetical protein
VILTLPIFSVLTDSADWVAIVRADNTIEAAIIAAAAMEPVMPAEKQLHVKTQTNNADAAARLGARDLIGWHFHARPNQ